MQTYRLDTSSLQSMRRTAGDTVVRSLNTLAAIDRAVEGFDEIARRARADGRYFQEAARQLRFTKPLTKVDPDGSLLEDLTQTRSSVDALKRLFSERREHIHATEEDLQAAANEAVEALDSFFDGLDDMIFSVQMHDCQLEPVLEATFTDVDALIAHLET